MNEIIASILVMAYYGAGVYILFYALWFAAQVFTGIGYRPALSNSRSFQPQPEILVLIPAYMPNKRLLEALDAIAASDYRGGLKTYVLLQECDPDLAAKVRDTAWRCDEHRFSHLPGNPYHHALKYAARRINSMMQSAEFHGKHIVLLDKDNVVEPGFFEAIADGIREGYHIVQGKRIPREITGAGQTYDAISEALNDTCFRAAPSRLGLGCELSGSAFAIEAALFSEAAEQLDGNTPGMDKNLLIQLLLLQPGLQMLFQPKACMREDKTARLETLETQRIRWFGAQYVNGLKYFSALLKTTFRRHEITPVLFGLNLMRPPRSLHVMLSIVFGVAEVSALLWFDFAALPMFFISALTMTIAGAAFLTNANINADFKSLIAVFPRIALGNARSVFHGLLPQNRAAFIHTNHEEVAQ